MKEFFKKVWERLKTALWRFLVSTWYVLIAIIAGVVTGLIWGQTVGVIVFFAIVVAFIAFVFLRQIWWFVSGTGDYYGRVGLLKKLWLLIFGKNEEDSDSKG